MKKILLGLGTIGMAILPLASVISCSNSKSIKSKLKNLQVNLNELASGDKAFKSYENLVLKQINSKLTSNEQKQISIDKNSENINLTTKNQNIKINIIDEGFINIHVKLNFDASSIAQRISALNIEVKRVSGQDNSTYYKDNIIRQLNKNLTQDELALNPIDKSAFNNINLNWTSKKQEINIKIGVDVVPTNFNLFFKYASQEKVLNDPNQYDKTNPLEFYMGGLNEIKISDWSKQDVKSSFREAWLSAGGISSDLDNAQDVSFVPIDLIKGQKVIVKMKCPALGYDGDPTVPASYKYFYVLPE